MHLDAGHAGERHRFEIEVSARSWSVRASEGENREVAVPDRKKALSVVFIEDRNQTKVARREARLQVFALSIFGAPEDGAG